MWPNIAEPKSRFLKLEKTLNSIETMMTRTPITIEAIMNIRAEDIISIGFSSKPRAWNMGLSSSSLPKTLPNTVPKNIPLMPQGTRILPSLMPLNLYIRIPTIASTKP